MLADFRKEELHPLVSLEKLMEDIVECSLAAGPLVKNITTDLDVAFSRSAVAALIPHWFSSVAPVFDMDFANWRMLHRPQTTLLSWESLHST